MLKEKSQIWMKLGKEDRNLLKVAIYSKSNYTQGRLDDLEF
jgi:hypothetical protein